MQYAEFAVRWTNVMWTNGMRKKLSPFIYISSEYFVSGLRALSSLLYLLNPNHLLHLQPPQPLYHPEAPARISYHTTPKLSLLSFSVNRPTKILQNKHALIRKCQLSILSQLNITNTEFRNKPVLSIKEKWIQLCPVIMNRTLWLTLTNQADIPEKKAS